MADITGKGQLSTITGNILKADADGQLYLTAADMAGGITGGISTGVINNYTVNMAMVSNASGKLAPHGSVTSTELGYLDGATSNIQAQIDALSGGGKLGWASGTTSVGVQLASDIVDIAASNTNNGIVLKAGYAFKALTITPRIAITSGSGSTLRTTSTACSIISIRNVSATDTRQIAQFGFAQTTQAAQSGSLVSVSAINAVPWYAIIVV